MLSDLISYNHTICEFGDIVVINLLWRKHGSVVEHLPGVREVASLIPR